MKHIIITPNENIDIHLLMNELSKVIGVSKVEFERSFALEGNELNGSDFENIVNEAKIDQYYSSEDAFKNLKDLGVPNKPESVILNEQKNLLNESLSEFTEGNVKSQEKLIAEFINWKNK